MAPALHRFSGDADSQDIFLWLKHIELTAACEGWDEPKQICNASNSLTGSAWTWAMSHNFTSWAQFKESICQRFGEEPETLAHKLQNFQQHPKESVMHYSDRFRFLAASLAITPCAYPSTLLRTIYVQGLHPDLQAAVVIKAPSTLDAAVKDAKYLEAQLGFFQNSKDPKISMINQHTSDYAFLRGKQEPFWPDD